LEAAEGHWHNPSSLSAGATAAREFLEDARDRLGELLGCDSQRIIFTGSATAATNAIARELGRRSPLGRAAVAALEHPCVAESFGEAFRERLVELPVAVTGRVDLKKAQAVIPQDGTTAVVSLLAASNETGVLQPWQELRAWCCDRQIPFHTDATQWLGRLPAAELGGCDYITGSGHKVGGPKGVGFLVVPEGAANFRGDRGGPQERGRWAGTENLPGVLAMVAALETATVASGGFAGSSVRARSQWRDQAEILIAEALPEVIVLGQGVDRLWNTLAILVPDQDGRRLVARLERRGLVASTGAACSSGSEATAKTVAAIGLERLGVAAERPWGMLRLSAAWDTPQGDWLQAAAAVVEAVQETTPPPQISFRP
jgi:cysteine desulfurase